MDVPEVGERAEPLVAVEEDIAGAELEMDDVPTYLAEPEVVDDDSTLAPYKEFSGIVPAALEASTRELLEGLCKIVAVEGPVVGDRLLSAYVRASGGRRVGRAIANALDRAVMSAVRRGVLVVDNPLGTRSVRARTYRLPDQPVVQVRQLGPRAFEQLPPAELAALIVEAAEVTGWNDEPTLYRATLGLLGLKRLTANVLNQLRQARRLTQR